MTNQDLAAWTVVCGMIVAVFLLGSVWQSVDRKNGRAGSPALILFLLFVVLPTAWGVGCLIALMLRVL